MVNLCSQLGIWQPDTIEGMAQTADLYFLIALGARESKVEVLAALLPWLADDCLLTVSSVVSLSFIHACREENALFLNLYGHCSHSEDPTLMSSCSFHSPISIYHDIGC